MAIRNHTNIIPYPLSGNGGGRTQTFVQGQPMSWLLRTLPKLSADGTKCNYLLGFMVTIVGLYSHVVNPSGSSYPNAFRNPGSLNERGAVRTMWDTIRALIDSVEVRSAWHGTPISSAQVKGSMLQILEFIGNGMETPYRQLPPLVATQSADDQYFRYSFFLPLCVLAGEKGHHTALPAVMYKDAELVINAKSSLAPFGRGTNEALDTLGATTFQVSALLLPEREVRVGPGVEWIDYRQAVSGNTFDLAGLGNSTALNRVQPGAGLASLLWLSSRNGLPGAGMVRNIADVAVPFLDMQQTQHPDPLIRQFEAMVGGRAMLAGPSTTAADGDGWPDEGAGDFAGFPYDDFDRGVSENGCLHAYAQLPPNPMFLALKAPPRDFETSKLTWVNGSQQVQITPVTGELFSGTHHVLALQYRAWTPEAWTSATQLLIEEGIPRAVLRTDDIEWSAKFLRKNPEAFAKMAPEMKALLPMAMRPKAGAQVSVR